MRAKARRYSANILAATFISGTEIISVTGDFDGGFVLATAVVNANPGVGQWVGLTFRVDGVSQGPSNSVFQSGGTLAVALTATLRVPQGRHRVSVYMAAGAAPAPSASADLSVAELNA